MIIEMILNPDLFLIIETLAERDNISVPQWIQDNLEKSAHEEQKEYIYREYINTFKE